MGRVSELRLRSEAAFGRRSGSVGGGVRAQAVGGGGFRVCLAMKDIMSL